MGMKQQSELIRDITDPGWREREAKHHAIFLERLAAVSVPQTCACTSPWAHDQCTKAAGCKIKARLGAGVRHG